MTEKLIDRLNPFPDKGEVWGKVIEVETKTYESLFYYEIKIDIVNENMIKDDSYIPAIIKKGGNDFLKSKPEYGNELFFYYLIIKTYDPYVMSFFKEKREDKYYKYKITSLDKNKTNIFRSYIEEINMNNNLYHHDKIIGEIFFTSSPTIKRIYRIQLTNEEKESYEIENKIPEECIYTDKSSLKKKISNVTNIFNIPIEKINIYHVGSGYYSHLESSTGDSFLHDIGLTICATERPSIVCPDYDSSRVKFIVLSHWDADHYMGITMHNQIQRDTLMSVPWICPSILSGSNASRLAFKIMFKSRWNLILVNQSVHGSIYQKGIVSLVKGYCAHGTQEEMKNGNGITVFIKNKKRFVALGDVYFSFLDQTNFPFKKADYFVIPHHGAYCSDSIKIYPRNKKSKAIIPVGINNNSHPNTQTKQTIEEMGYKIHRTDNNGPLEIELL